MQCGLLSFYHFARWLWFNLNSYISIVLYCDRYHYHSLQNHGGAVLFLHQSIIHPHRIGINQYLPTNAESICYL